MNRVYSAYSQCSALYFHKIFRFEKVEALGVAVLEKTPNAQDVRDKMKKLADDKDAIDDMYQKRLKDLQDAYDLQVKYIFHYNSCFLNKNHPFKVKTLI